VKRWLPSILNVVLFDALWTLAVLGAGKPWWWAAPVLILLSALIQLRFSPVARAEGLLILIGAAAGTSLDVLCRSLNLFHFASASHAEFILIYFALWINFGATLRPSFQWAWKRPFLASLLGAIGGPFADWTATRLGAVTPIEPAWRYFAWSAAQFALALPLWMLAASAFIPTPRLSLAGDHP
jgi:hypothetical protein